MALGRKGLTSGAMKGLTSGAIKRLTVCCVTVSACCFVLLCYAEQYKAACWC
ncbi:unnamed protein product [Staurois parvus]|uniref:Uncharacterized protein n=1 Tax=Staurois parvus TaxID=386267 RepID=A0ABN9CAX2_9NEOB|nr:unnamed protein product [Staurois parvus]